MRIRKGLRYKLMVAFGYMTIIPLLVCAYILLVYVFPQSDNIGDVSLLLLLALVVALLGLELAKRLIDPMSKMARKARRMASGEYALKFSVDRNDEIGILGEAINRMTERIRVTLDEIKGYGQRTRQASREVERKTLALSHLLSLGEGLSENSLEMGEILDMAVQKAAAIFETGYSVLYLSSQMGHDYIARYAFNAEHDDLRSLAVKPGEGPLGMAVRDRTVIVIDSSTPMAKDTEAFRQSYGVKNIVGVPVGTARADFGILVVGNRLDGFSFRTDDIDLAKIFAKQISLALEKEMLTAKARELMVKDDVTGLYNRNSIMMALEEEIKRSIFYQRSCAFILFAIDDLDRFFSAIGEGARLDVARKLGRLMKDGATPIGKAARVSANEFAVLLPEKNKLEADQAAETIRRMADVTNVIKDERFNIAVRYGASEYPADGSTADELFKKAADQLMCAKAP